MVLVGTDGGVVVIVGSCLPRTLYLPSPYLHRFHHHAPTTTRFYLPACLPTTALPTCNALIDVCLHSVRVDGDGLNVTLARFRTPLSRAPSMPWQHTRYAAFG